MKAVPKTKRPPPVEERVESALTWLKAHASKATLAGMARYAIPSRDAFGVAMKDVKALGKKLGRDHDLALALWETGRYEARLLVSFVADPSALTRGRASCGNGPHLVTPPTAPGVVAHANFRARRKNL